uniref:Uncharacterized protein n=1 Tax=Heterorhabditis bacteriophora TaxID=37862 RepID=A0A1I7XEZ2_HETBA
MGAGQSELEHPNQKPAPDQPFPLPTVREKSTIPKACHILKIFLFYIIFYCLVYAVILLHGLLNLFKTIFNCSQLIINFRQIVILLFLYYKHLDLNHYYLFQFLTIYLLI